MPLINSGALRRLFNLPITTNQIIKTRDQLAKLILSVANSNVSLETNDTKINKNTQWAKEYLDNNHDVNNSKVISIKLLLDLHKKRTSLNILRATIQIPRANTKANNNVPLSSMHTNPFPTPLSSDQKIYFKQNLLSNDVSHSAPSNPSRTHEPSFPTSHSLNGSPTSSHRQHFIFNARNDSQRELFTPFYIEKEPMYSLNRSFQHFIFTPEMSDRASLFNNTSGSSSFLNNTTSPLVQRSILKHPSDHSQIKSKPNEKKLRFSEDIEVYELSDLSEQLTLEEQIDQDVQSTSNSELITPVIISPEMELLSEALKDPMYPKLDQDIILANKHKEQNGKIENNENNENNENKDKNKKEISFQKIPRAQYIPKKFPT